MMTAGLLLRKALKSNMGLLATGYRPTLAGLWKLGFGTATTNMLVTIQQDGANLPISGLINVVLLANSPQFGLSLIYYMYVARLSPMPVSPRVYSLTNVPPGNVGTMGSALACSLQMNGHATPKSAALSV